MQTKNNTLAEPINFLQQVIANGGPETTEYDALNQVFDILSNEYKSGKLTIRNCSYCKMALATNACKTLCMVT